MKIFDLDGTICESRQVISPEMKEKLSGVGKFIVISGAERPRIERQLDGLPCIIMAQSGNDTDLWKNKLTLEEKMEVFEHINKLDTEWSLKTEDRGCQISYSFIGHAAPMEQKKQFDHTGIIRRRVLKRTPFNSKTLTCSIAGTTCIDYTRKDCTKGKNIERWIKKNKLNKKDCIYYGDKLFKGGNDESVMGIIKTVSVKNPKDLLSKL